MPVLEEILDADARAAGGKNLGLEPNKPRKQGQDEYDIPEGLPGSSNPKRGRGRPRGSTKSSSKSSAPISSITQSTWERITALGLNYTTAIIAARIVGDSKYMMTQYEAESAAKGLVIWMFQYKQIRDIAAMTDIGGPNGALIKGFMPYIGRVFIREIIANVLNGPPLSQSIRARRPKRQQSRNGFNASTVTGTEPRTDGNAGPVFSDTSGNGPYNGHNSESTTPRFLAENLWSDDG